ncbi:hypothetical protein OHS33_36095 [Streptomyces sp. NBC_00536]|uniref:hypothetical protein n=1 Tax=Streptomyces sp. NBC_00536 TaxID=2975769 RepID=UPI002E8219D8|nr:hypothetical protein [Streptomyces sp. NBC_00536]WUC83325.1 hypothetical protein OHS33_36095 [Streptomyces sp. NBC_00536]
MNDVLPSGLCLEGSYAHDCLNCRIPRQCRSEPRGFLGVDGFAFRKGRAYGTILVDVEVGHVVDVLPTSEPPPTP